MKVLFITDGITPFVIGGMQKHSHGLVKNLIAQGIQVTLVHCVFEGQRLPSLEEVKQSLDVHSDAKLEIFTFRFPKGNGFPGHYIKSSYSYSTQVYEKFKNTLSDFDFIYTKGFTGWYFIEKKKKGESLPPIAVKFHGYEMFQLGGSFSMRLKKMLLKGPALWISTNADYVFSYGSKITELIKSIGVNSSKIVEVPTAIDDAWIIDSKPIQEGPVKILFIGRYERRKGIEELNEVILKLPESTDLIFEFVGPIPQSKRLKRSDVLYHGEQKERQDILRIIDGCQVLICPSHSEGMPNVILEAMARGLCVLASDVGATNLMVRNNESGFLFPPANQEGILNVLNSVMKMSKNQIHQMGEEGRILVKSRFSWLNVSELTINEMRKRLGIH
jgi:glycosyltransferase involved in cell wall biosynthesis